MSLDLGTDAVTVMLYALFVLSAAGIPLYVLHTMQRQFRGDFGRPYGQIVDELMSEGVRRSQLITRAGEIREARLARQERRLEGGR